MKNKDIKDTFLVRFLEKRFAHSGVVVVNLGKTILIVLASNPNQEYVVTPTAEEPTDEYLRQVSDDIQEWLNSPTVVASKAFEGRQEFLDRAAIALYAKHGQSPKCWTQAEELWKSRVLHMATKKG